MSKTPFYRVELYCPHCFSGHDYKGCFSGGVYGLRDEAGFWIEFPTVGEAVEFATLRAVLGLEFFIVDEDGNRLLDPLPKVPAQEAA